jgi:hypothetical protein
MAPGCGQGVAACGHHTEAHPARARSLTAHRQLKPYRQRKNGLGNTVVMPLHRKIKGNDGKGVVTRAELISTMVLGVEGDRCL